MTAQMAKFGLRMVSVIVLARLLTPSDFGLVAMVTVITGFMEMFKDAGLALVTVQRRHITHEQISTLFWINAGIGILLMGITAALAPAIAWFYREPRLIPITLTIAGVFVFPGLSIQHRALLRRQMRFKALAAIDITAMLLGILASIAIAASTYSYWSLVAMPVVVSAATAVGAWVASGWLPGAPRSGTGVKSMLKFGGSVTGSNAIYYFARQGDNFLIGWKYGAEQLGLYSKAYHLLMLPIEQILGPLSAAMVPMLSRLQADSTAYRNAFMRFYGILALVLMPATAGFVSLARPLILILLGPQWEQATAIFAYLAIAGFYMPLATAINWLFISQGRPGEMFITSGINAVLAVASFIVGLPYGGVGVAAAFAVSGLLVRFPILVYIAGRKGTVSIRHMTAALIVNLPAALAVGLACNLALRVLENQAIVMQLTGGLFAAAIVFTFCVLVIPARRREVRASWRTIREALASSF
jgi:PST family polysaccharide transporter